MANNNPAANRKDRLISAILIAVALLSAVVFLYRVVSAIFGNFTWDATVYYSAAENFLSTGQLYQRFSDYQQGYAPGAAVYKFPPAYQLTLVPFLKLGINGYLLLVLQRIVYFCLYIGAIHILIKKISFLYFTESKNTKPFIFICWIMAMWFLPFFDCLPSIEPELIVFLLLVITFYFSTSKPLLAGAILTFATSVKIYPIFLAIYFIAVKKWLALCGFIVGGLLLGAITIYVFGVDEHIFYLGKVLRILLSEGSANIAQNITIESFFFNHGLIHQMDGLIANIVKWLVVAVSLIIGLFFTKNDQAKMAIYFGMITSGTLLYLTNYWLQYQIILLIPIFILMGYAFNKNSTSLIILLSLICVVMSVNDRWLSSLFDIYQFSELRVFVPVILFFMSGWILTAHKLQTGK